MLGSIGGVMSGSTQQALTAVARGARRARLGGGPPETEVDVVETPPSKYPRWLRFVGHFALIATALAAVAGVLLLWGWFARWAYDRWGDYGFFVGFGAPWLLAFVTYCAWKQSE